MFSSLPHAVLCGVQGGYPDLFRELLNPVLKVLLLCWWLGALAPVLVKAMPSPNLVANLRRYGWTIGRFETTIDTKVSRHAH